MPDMSGIRRFQFLISQGAKDDLKACKEEDSYAAAKISELLRDVRDDIIAGEALVFLMLLLRASGQFGLYRTSGSTRIASGWW